MLTIISIIALGGVIVLSIILGIYLQKSSRLQKQLTLTKSQLAKEIEYQQKIKNKLLALENNITSNRLDDQITGLPARRVFEDRLIQMINQSQRYSLIFGVMILELDGFREIKNVLGLEACNELIKETATRLKSCIRPMDTVSHSAINEFIFLVPQLAKPETAAYVAKRLLETIAEPITIRGQKIFLTASIGIAVYPTDGLNANTLLQSADNALLQAKSHGNNNYQFYQKDMHSLSQRELSLSSGLHNTAVYQDFEIYYQPWVNTETKKIICMEAFINWNHPEFGLVSQEDFLRLAEKSGNIIMIGEWLLRNAISQFVKWRELGFKPDYLAINISLRQLENPHFAYQVSKILQELKLDVAHLIFEISELLIVNKMDIITKSLRMFKQLGVKIAINHFGAGNIALQNLRGLPIHYLKLDQSLIKDMHGSKETEAIVKMIMALAKTLKLEVVAESVANATQKQLLKECECEIMQGDIICPPIAVQDFTAAVEKRITESV